MLHVKWHEMRDRLCKKSIAKGLTVLGRVTYVHFGWCYSLPCLIDGQDIYLIGLVDGLIVDGQFVGVLVNDPLLKVSLFPRKVMTTPSNQVMEPGRVVLHFRHQLKHTRHSFHIILLQLNLTCAVYKLLHATA